MHNFKTNSFYQQNRWPERSVAFSHTRRHPRAVRQCPLQRQQPVVLKAFSKARRHVTRAANSVWQGEARKEQVIRRTLDVLPSVLLLSAVLNINFFLSSPPPSLSLHRAVVCWRACLSFGPCVCACVRVRACVRACARARACVCVCVCARARVGVCVFVLGRLAGWLQGSSTTRGQPIGLPSCNIRDNECTKFVAYAIFSASLPMIRTSFLFVRAQLVS